MSIAQIVKHGLVILVLVGWIAPAWAQADTVQVKLSRDADSITIFIPAVNGWVSLKGMSIESPDLSQGLGARRGVRLDQASGFAGLDFDRLPTPICLRLLRVGAQVPPPIDCSPGQAAIFVVGLDDSSIFWHDPNFGALNVIVRQDNGDGDIGNDTQLALCPSGTALCVFTIPVSIGPTPTPLPEVVADRLAVQAVESFKAGRYADAANEAGQYIQLKPNDAFGYLLRALARVFVKAYDDALADYEQALALEDSTLDYHAYLGRGNVYLDLDNPQAAIDDFTRAIELQPGAAIPYYLRARAYGELNRYDAAIQDFQAARDKGMNSAIVLLELGRMYYERGDLDNALVSYDGAVANNPGMAAAYAGRSVVHRALGNTQQAIDDSTRALQPPATATPSSGSPFEITIDNVINVFTVALSIDSGVDTAGIYCDRGAMYLEMEDYAAATADFDNARLIDGRSVCAFTGLALAYSYLGDAEQVSQNVSAALFLQPSDAVTYNSLGAALMNVDGFEDAVPLFSQAVAIDSSEAAYYRNRATAYLNLNQYPAAVDDYEKAIELGDQQADTFYNLGVAYLRLENPPQAIASLTRALGINSADPRYYYARGNAYLAAGDYAPALQDYEQAAALGFNDVGLYFNRGVVLFNQREYATAAESFSQAITLGMDSGDVYYNRGLSYYNLNQFDGAARDFQAAVDHDPTNADFHYLLADSLLRVNPADCNALPHLREYIRLAGAEARPEAQSAVSQLEPGCG